MYLNRSVAIACILFAFPTFSNAENSIFQELRECLSSKKLISGVNLKTGEVVGTGVCEGGARTYERARLAAVADVVTQLNTSSFSSSRFTISSDDSMTTSEAMEVACSGYLIGAEEVARIVRKSSDGESVAVAVLWSIARQERAMSSLANTGGNVKEVVAELQKCNDLVNRTGPVLWNCASGQQRFLGVGVCKFSGEAPKEIRSAMRLATVKAQRNLAEHFRRVITVTEEHCLNADSTDKSASSASAALNSFLSTIKSQTRGTLGHGRKALTLTDYGVSEILSEIRTIDNVKYALSVCCLTTKDMVEVE